MGPEALKIYNTLKEDGESETVARIFKKLEDFAQPKHNVVMSHFCFFKRKQGEGESVDKYITELRYLVASCDFKELEEKMLRTQLILGLRDLDLQSRLLREDLPLKKVLTYCQAVEEADKNVKILEKAIEVTTISHKTYDKPNSSHKTYV